MTENEQLMQKNEYLEREKARLEAENQTIQYILNDVMQRFEMYRKTYPRENRLNNLFNYIKKSWNQRRLLSR